MFKTDPVSLDIGDKEMAMSDQNSGLKPPVSCKLSQRNQNKALLNEYETNTLKLSCTGAVISGQADAIRHTPRYTPSKIVCL
jgi:hypothetical protein